MGQPSPLARIVIVLSTHVIMGWCIGGGTLCYANIELSTCSWRAMGLVCTYIVRIVPELAEEGCTTTLYLHGWRHTWLNPRTPMLCSDEAGERHLRVAKRQAPVTSIQQDASISETLKHELYQKFA